MQQLNKNKKAAFLPLEREENYPNLMKNLKNSIPFVFEINV